MDVTEHELLTQELRLREAYLAEAQRLAIQEALDGSLPPARLSGPTRPSYLRVRPLGQANNRFSGQRVHPQDRADFKKVIDRAFAGATDFEHGYRLLIPDGRIKHVHAIAHAAQNVCGNREFIGAVSDITERKTQKTRSGAWSKPAFWESSSRPSRVESWRPTRRFYKCCNTAVMISSRVDCAGRISRRPNGANAMNVPWQSSWRLEFFRHTRRVFRKDGSRVPVLVGGARMQSPDEGVVFVLDLSEQKRAEEKVRISESYLAEAQRLSQTGSWAWSPEQDIRYWSDECYRVLSFDPQEGLPRFEEFLQRIHPDDRPGLMEVIETAIRKKADWETDYRIVHPDGPVRDIHVVAHPVLSASGHLVEFVGTVIDVTERNRAEEERRRSEMELRQIADLVPQMVAVFGARGERLYANRIGLDYIGLSLEEWQQTP